MSIVDSGFQVEPYPLGQVDLETAYHSTTNTIRSPRHESLPVVYCSEVLLMQVNLQMKMTGAWS